ncbi:MAG: methyltransferase family protein [Gemmatimonadaceae bacterium]
MKPLPFVRPYALVFWLVFIWAFFAESRIVRRAQRMQGATDSRSLQVIMIGQGIAYVVAFWMAFMPGLRVAPTHERLVFALGLVAIIAGALLRRHCWRMLGASFTGDVRARPDQEVVSRGAYRILRHPSYSAGILLNTGVGIALGSWASALLLAAASFAVYLYRIGVEERALVATIGEPYRQFMIGRKRLIPFVY